MTRYRITDQELADAVAKSHSMYGVLNLLGIKLAGGSFSHYKQRIIALGISMDHFSGQSWSKGKVSTSRKTSSEILVLRLSGTRAKSHQLVRAMIEEGVEHCCSKCGQNNEWQGHPLTLDVDHINENWLDDRLENLRFLCPNCHSQFSRKLLGI